MKKLVLNDFNEAAETLAKFMGEPRNLQAVERAGDLMAGALRKGKKVLSCGNGGSLSDAMHFAEELTGRFRDNRKPMPAMAISDPSHLTCVANDFGYDAVFSRVVEAMGQKGDVLLAISTSGNSKNVLNAIHTAKKKGMKVIGLTGKGGGEMAKLCDVEVRAPHTAYSDRAQEIHIKVIHTLIHYIEENI